MIVLGKATEAKAASATSTYPAVVVAIGNPSSALVKLWFYCPATMSGLPKDAKNPGGNNVVEAPRKPHEGDIEYNYQVGDVIIISYADGNLNTPQFVRYVTISDDVRAINNQYVGGDAIISGGYFNIDDTNVTLNSDILQKAISLLPAVRLCAKGSDNNYKTYSIHDGLNNPFFSDVVFVKCGIYGTEFATLDAPNIPNFDLGEGWSYLALKVPLDLEYNGGIYEPDITFLDFVRYLYNGGIYIKTYESIIDTFKNGFIKHGYTVKDGGIPKDEYMSLYLFQALAGLDDWETGAKRINSAVYEENKKENDGKKPVLTIDAKGLSGNQVVDDLYDMYSVRTSTVEDIWTQFTVDYRKELDRLYAIILHNNIWRLKQRVGYYSATNLLLLILAVIATSWQILEYMIVSGNTAVFDQWEKDDDDKNDNNYSAQLSNILAYLYNKNMTVAEIRAKSNEIAEFFAQAFTVIINREGSNNSEVLTIKNHIKDNIITTINYILSNSDKYLNIFGTTITGVPITGGGSGSTANSETAKRVIEIASENVGATNGNKFISWYNTTNNTSYSSGTAWCAIFVMYCMRNAGVNEQSVPEFVGCITGVNAFKKLGRFYYKGSYEPRPGDVVFFEWDGQSGDVDHTGIVEYVDSNNTLHTIEGNSNNECARRTYSNYKTNAFIVGYGVPLYNVGSSSGSSSEGGSVSTNTKCRVLQTRKAQITQHYGNGGHTGTDLVGEPNSLDGIVAHTAGTVIWTQTGFGNAPGTSGNASYGNAVKIKHSNGYATLYAHMEYISVETGQTVKQGQKIGYMGNTGNSYGAHLHFEVRNQNDNTINSEPYLNANLP
nr:peptidase [Caudoviricetes sp.]